MTTTRLAILLALSACTSSPGPDEGAGTGTGSCSMSVTFPDGSTRTDPLACDGTLGDGAPGCDIGEVVAGFADCGAMSAEYITGTPSSTDAELWLTPADLDAAAANIGAYSFVLPGEDGPNESSASFGSTAYNCFSERDPGGTAQIAFTSTGRVPADFHGTVTAQVYCLSGPNYDWGPGATLELVF